MPGMRFLFEFASQQFSWSEAYIWTTPTQPTFLSAQPALYALAAARVPLLGVGASLARVRMSQFPASRQVFDVLPPSIVSAPDWTQFAAGTGGVLGIFLAGRPYSCILIRAFNIAGDFKQIFLGGIPGGITHQTQFNQLGLDLSLPGDFASRLNNFIQVLATGSYGWVTRKDEAQQTAALVTNAAWPGFVVVSVANALTFADPLHPRVRVRGFRRINPKLPGVDRLWPVAAIIAPTAPATTPWLYVLQGSAGISLTNYSTVGTASGQFFSFRTISGSIPVLAVERKRGVSLGAPRGRRSTRP